jgi:hypothetical protein
VEDFDDGTCLIGDVLVGDAKRTAVLEGALRILAIHAGEPLYGTAAAWKQGLHGSPIKIERPLAKDMSTAWASLNGRR